MGSEHIEVKVVHGSILDAEAQVIVNAANSLGLMGGGVAGVIKRAAGAEVEREAVKDAPIRVGKAVLTSGGKTKFRGIIHAPTMPEPGMRIPAENVAFAIKAALELADEKGFESIAISGMGTGVGGVAHADAAAKMIREIQAFSPRTLKSVVLVDVDPEMVAAWRDCLADSK
ncbi:MAG: macro domain-containing protein [Nitrospiraceae bacterium]